MGGTSTDHFREGEKKLSSKKKFGFFPKSCLGKELSDMTSEMNEDLMSRRRVSIRTVDGCLVDVPMSIAR